ncbi:MAG: Gfo/Idh/MocA family oxidoreductase [Lentisphaeria bacterium]|nr:Gfo/Idh/MocA family oxidoreductase [Lentisphaeria bacterium]
MNDLRIGVLGAGGRGGLARHAHKPGEGSAVVACCDTDESVFERMRTWYGEAVSLTSSMEDFLAQDLDAVMICTPDFLHEEQAVAVLRKGLPVYLEKPLAITVEGCDRILRTSVENHAPLYLGHNMRHMSFVLKMKELIDSGAIGQVKTAWCRHFVGHGGDFYFKDWHADRRLTTSLLLQKAAHDIDVLHWLAGGYGKIVNALGGLTVYGGIKDRHAEDERGCARVNLENWPPLSQKQLNPVVDVEDVSMLNMELDNGVFVAYQQCHFSPDYWRNYTFIGTEGRIENVGDGQEGTHIKLWNKRVHGCGFEADRIFPIETGSGGHGGADARIVPEFLDFVRGKCKASTSPVAARYSVAVGCAATESLRNGGIPITVPPLDQTVASHFRQWCEG